MTIGESNDRAQKSASLPFLSYETNLVSEPIGAVFLLATATAHESVPFLFGGFYEANNK